MAVVASALAGPTFATMPCSAADSTRRTLAKDAAYPKCWQSFVSDIKGEKRVTPAIKDDVRRHGIPASLRADAYYALSGAVSLQHEHAGTYSALAASTSSLSDDVLYSVEDDVRNVRVTFKDSRLFSTAKGAETLSRIVFAYLQYNPACGYFKGLGHIAALLLTTFGREREEQAFWTLAALLKRRCFPSCDGQASLGSHVEAHALQLLLEQRQPALAAILSKLRADAVEQLATAWFATAFTRALPHEVVLRIWDCLMVEGPKVLQRVAMALVKMCASSIQSCTNLETLCRVLEGRLARTTDADALLSVAFKGLGSLSGSTVDAARARAMSHVQNQQRLRSSPLAPLSMGASGLIAKAASGPLSVSSRGSNASSSSSAGGGSHISSGGLAVCVSRPGSKQAVQWASPKSTGALLSLA
ncbi:hypothetical protein GPECTOR_42g784 [Gonium pectorale]|uniref:Rab-GAP TBC domain-containing protein n=1 Tax=Gonium pectorale TaxID=33097 RepID=A0A150G9Q3_GONPE|nr:hypothetical protein GPECTOR_42g784 [Gonium pectorale]|eukprot:KXZ46574.1 hypothetical protein GPECTOR_42g784 [Gonium pectorale]